MQKFEQTVEVVLLDLDKQVVWETNHDERVRKSQIVHIVRHKDPVVDDDALAHIDKSVNVDRLVAVWE